MTLAAGVFTNIAFWFSIFCMRSLSMRVVELQLAGDTEDLPLTLLKTPYYVQHHAL